MSNPYIYIGKDGKPVLARDLEDERDALKAENAELKQLIEDIRKDLRMRIDMNNCRGSKDGDGYVFPLGHSIVFRMGAASEGKEG